MTDSTDDEVLAKAMGDFDPDRARELIEALSAGPVSVSMEGSQWVGLHTALEMLLPAAQVLSIEMWKDMSVWMDVIMSQVNPVLNERLSRDDIIERLRAAGL